MRTVPRTSPLFRRSGRYSLRATWRALHAFPTARFPLLLPGVHPLASFFILWRLKGLGFSECRVVDTESGLAVHAHR